MPHSILDLCHSGVLVRWSLRVLVAIQISATTSALVPCWYVWWTGLQLRGYSGIIWYINGHTSVLQYNCIWFICDPSGRLLGNYISYSGPHIFWTIVLGHIILKQTPISDLIRIGSGYPTEYGYQCGYPVSHPVRVWWIPNMRLYKGPIRVMVPVAKRTRTLNSL